MEMLLHQLHYIYWGQEKAHATTPRNRSSTGPKSKRSRPRDWSGVAEADRTDNYVDPIIFLCLYFLVP